MVIRFQCPACRQPIEVDGEWADKTVACPYCRRHVAAPGESTFEAADETSVAAPVWVESPVAHAPALSPIPASPGTRRNTVALVAFILACSVLVQLGIVMALMATHTMEMMEIQEAATDMKGQFEAMQAFIDEHGGTFPGWFVAAMLFEFSAMACWVACVICGIIGVRRAERRVLAIGALVIAGMVLLLFCAGTLLSVAGVAAY